MCAGGITCGRVEIGLTELRHLLLLDGVSIYDAVWSVDGSVDAPVLINCFLDVSVLVQQTGKLESGIGLGHMDEAAFLAPHDLDCSFLDPPHRRILGPIEVTNTLLNFHPSAKELFTKLIADNGRHGAGDQCALRGGIPDHILVVPVALRVPKDILPHSGQLIFVTAFVFDDFLIVQHRAVVLFFSQRGGYDRTTEVEGCVVASVDF